MAFQAPTPAASPFLVATACPIRRGSVQATVRRMSWALIRSSWLACSADQAALRERLHRPDEGRCWELWSGYGPESGNTSVVALPPSLLGATSASPTSSPASTTMASSRPFSSSSTGRISMTSGCALETNSTCPCGRRAGELRQAHDRSGSGRRISTTRSPTTSCATSTLPRSPIAAARVGALSGAASCAPQSGPSRSARSGCLIELRLRGMRGAGASAAGRGVRAAREPARGPSGWEL